MIHDWNGNGRKNDMFDDLMDYIMYNETANINDDEDDEDDE